MSHIDRGGRWRSWLSHLSNTQKVLSSNLGRLIFLIKPTSVHMLPPFRKAFPLVVRLCSLLSPNSCLPHVQWEYFVSHEFLPVKFSFIKLANRWVDLPIRQTLAIKSRVQSVAKTIRMVPVKILAGAFTEAFIATYSFNPQTASLTVMSRQPTGGNCSWIFQHPTNGSVL